MRLAVHGDIKNGMSIMGHAGFKQRLTVGRFLLGYFAGNPDVDGVAYINF